MSQEYRVLLPHIFANPHARDYLQVLSWFLFVHYKGFIVLEGYSDNILKASYVNLVLG